MVVANFDAQTPCRLYVPSAAKFSKKRERNLHHVGYMCMLVYMCMYLCEYVSLGKQ